MEGGPGAAARPIQFALTPGQTPSGLVDYSTKEGRKSFYKDTEKLPDTFNGQSEGLTLFQSQLKDKAAACGWNNGHPTEDVIQIPIEQVRPNDTRDIIQEYTQLSVEAINAWCIPNLIAINDRRAQNNYNMFMCIKQTLTPEVQNNMELDREQYTVQDVVIAALYYKILVGKAEVGTQATIALTRNSLTRLDQKMLEVDSNVEKFNDFVKLCRRKLSDRRTHSSDLLVNLFTGYRATRDSKFVESISKIEEDYLYGTTPNLTDTQLMDQALKIYQVRVESGAWGALSAEQEMIVAMQAKFDEIKDNRLKLDTSTKSKKKKGKDYKKDKTSRAGDEANWAWKNKNNSNLPTLNKLGKKYYWCKHHNQGQGMWVLHKPENCKNKVEDDATESGETLATDAVANRAIAELEDSDSDQESE